ncbi:iron-sulfur protein [Deferribacter desulfuricans SSM1]|uniref:Iron-sulfur protein n=1 Tax=Deferribacter desulfuricans (strain DSM 14783 / JCM 11476 / NBRC 101012 / SSM1) TaxID=639282 RepID=D3PC31_DEFDS|nr:Rieske (2Fe-2S) protein [Deferribacter desulfuricans]BAI80154.1 iron-sulfur protein [Deferribacter desulfuricans SSM1]
MEFKNLLKRRNFLKLIFLLPIYFIYKFLKIDAAKSNKMAITLDLNQLSDNSVLLLRDEKVAVVNKNNKVYALSIKCTHLGCTLNSDGEKFVCPCHGSKFSFDGKVLHGPANKDLNKLNFKINKNKIKIYLL